MLVYIYQGNNNGDDDFSLLQPLDIITKDVDELQKILKEKKAELQKDKDLEKDAGRERERERQEREKEREKEKEKGEKDKQLEREREKGKQPEEHKDKDVAEVHEDTTMVKTEPNGISSGKVIYDFLSLFVGQFLLLWIYKSLMSYINRGSSALISMSRI